MKDWKSGSGALREAPEEEALIEDDEEIEEDEGPDYSDEAPLPYQSVRGPRR